jgi:O-antigen ligase
MIVLATLRPEAGRRLFSRNLLRTGGLVFSATLLFSFSRASLLSLLAALTAAAFLHRESLLPHWHRTKAVLVGVLGGLALAVLAFPAYTESYVYRILGTAFWAFHDPRDLLSGRFQAWESLIDFLAAHPWHLLFGIGFKTLPYTTVADRPLIADNMFLSMLVETGVVGLLAMLLLHGVILVSAYRASRGRTVASFLGAQIFRFWIGQLFQMLLADTLTYWRVLPLYFAVLALAVREVDRTPQTGLHP